VTQNLPDKLSNLPISRAEGIQSILTLLNLLKEPAILYNREEDEILTANNAFFLITNLGEMEFIGSGLNTIFPESIDTDPISGHDKNAFLRHKNQPSIPVNVRIFTMSNNGENILILLKPESIKPAIKQSITAQSNFIEKLQSIFLVPKDRGLHPTIQETINEAAHALDMEFLCIYNSESDSERLTQYLNNSEGVASKLPKSLSKDEYTNEVGLNVWTREEPTHSQLQKGIVNAGLNFLITTPIQNSNEDFGLLIAAGKHTSLSANSGVLINLVASYLCGLLEDQRALNKLRNLANKIKQVVKIQNEIITNLEEGVLILSPDLLIAEINPAVEALLGYANIEALRQPIDAILIGTESLGAAFKSAQQGIPSMTGGELRLHHRNGNSFPAQVTTFPVTQNDQVLAIIVLVRDMSQEQQSQAVSKQLEQRAILGEVTAIFAHEVRNPINAIMLSLQVMEENLSETDENHKWIDNIRDECNKLMYLMDSVLSFAKPLEYRMAGVDLNFLLPKILERWHPRFLRLNISSFYESDIINPIIEGDMRALEQVFTNLISNSVNAMSDSGGSLTVKITEPESEEDRRFLQITLTDSGHGIPDEIKAHMFKPFVTGSSHGTGLGLAITQRIINAHKGKIEVESFTGGTVFKIFLAKKKGPFN
jgi:PAS domain S-box-containing protein